jgi:protein-S-isoprenylcysteine O-methyltransferase Ste14
MTASDWIFLVVVSLLASVALVVAREAIFKLLELVLVLLLGLLELLLILIAWAWFLATWWHIPKNPLSRTLETNGFFLTYLACGQTLYSQNLAWRRDLSKHRAAVRDGEKPIPRFRFTWRGYLRALFN